MRTYCHPFVTLLIQCALYMYYYSAYGKMYTFDIVYNANKSFIQVTICYLACSLILFVRLTVILNHTPRTTHARTHVCIFIPHTNIYRKYICA